MSDQPGTFHAPQYGRPGMSEDERARRSCYMKRRYCTEAEARRTKAKREDAAGTLRVYACFVCGGYHLTKT